MDTYLNTDQDIDLDVSIRDNSHKDGKGRARRNDARDQRLGFLMHDVSRLRRMVFDEFMKPLNVTRSQWWVLAHLARRDGMTQSDLAQELEVGKAALGGLIDRLEAGDFVQRRPDGVDRRVKRIYLKNTGTRMLEEMHLRSNEMSDRILEGLSEDQRQSLVDMLTVIKHNLRGIQQENET
uniref:MarR family winged helix-turn-helix transcriptional regulator n=1 Tax=Castellaniella sp. TaxID=1955812 RepID=UPI00356305DF